jgi:hypothetical protein
MKLLAAKFLALTLGFVAYSAHAAVATCTLDSFTINTMTSSVTGIPVALPGAIQATGCFGVNAGNDAQGGLNEPSPNLGHLGDGLLNGGTFKGVQLVDPGQFIDDSQFQAIKDPTKPVDPGWIMLGTLNGKFGTMKPYGKPLDFGDLLSFQMNANKTWSLTTNPNLVQILNDNGLFGRSYFDHLAFVVKAGDGSNQSTGGWAIYDFDFNKLLAAAPGAFSLATPYSFTGTWNTDDFGGKDISHMSVWARDPISTTNVPVPGTVFLAGIGLLALGLVRKKSCS